MNGKLIKTITSLDLFQLNHLPRLMLISTLNLTQSAHQQVVINTDTKKQVLDTQLITECQTSELIRKSKMLRKTLLALSWT